jgi:signal transduction histidine kinase
MPGLAALSLDHFQAEALRLREESDLARDALAQQRGRMAELELAARELESFSSSVSHDLRAPLRVVDGFARLLKEDFGHGLDRVAHDHLNRILSAATRMNAMIDALLKLARVSSEPVEPARVDVSALARQLCDEFAAQYPEREVSVSIQPGMSAQGDRVLLGIALQNLIGNAWKYTAHTDAGRIEVDCRVDDGVTVYRVSDNGAGFDMRFADRLFRVFQRLHSASDFPGTGVGLATVARIVRRHHGRVWAQSEPGKGARFQFTVGETGSQREAR